MSARKTIEVGRKSGYAAFWSGRGRPFVVDDPVDAREPCDMHDECFDCSDLGDGLYFDEIDFAEERDAYLQ